MKTRFSKVVVLQVLDAHASRIGKEQRFDRSNGTSQLYPRNFSEPEASQLQRAVEYGRMKAFEQLAESIREGFQFEECES